MAEVHLAFTRLAGEPGRGRLLVVGPSLGTSVEALWGLAAARLGGHLDVLGWDLPGHGRGAPTTSPFDISDLAAAVRRDIGGILGDSGRTASYAGVSLGGAVALELAVDPGPFTDLACIASAARLGDPEAWHERAALVREVGTSVLLAGAAEQWFAPGFVDRSPTSAHRLLRALSDADPESYALACEALARFDMRDRMGEAEVPLLIAPGEHDVVVTPDTARSTAAAAVGARVHVMTGCGHLPPAEDPAGMVAVLREHIEERTRG